jgi:predicted ATP-grasp superfamily ATP-dependent carboligase
VRTLIAGLTTRAVAESAVRGGFDVVTVDYFGDLDQKRLCPNVSLRERGLPYSAEGLLGLAVEIPADALVYVGGLENHPGAVARLARGRRLLGNAPETLARVRDPRRLLAFLAGRGFQVPGSLEPEGGAPAASADGRWLVKPAAGGGGRGIRPWRGEPVRSGRIVQERIVGRPASASFAADGRESVLLHWSEQLPGPGGFRYGGNLVPLDAPPAAREEVSRIAADLTAEFGLVGLNGVDFVLRDGRPVVLEVNPRYSASMELIEQLLGASLFGLHVAACGGDLDPARRASRAPPAPDEERWRGKRIVYATATVEVTHSAVWIERGVRDVPSPGDLVRRGQPICTVLASGASRPLCLARLQREAAVILAECGPARR